MIVLHIEAFIVVILATFTVGFYVGQKCKLFKKLTNCKQFKKPIDKIRKVW